MTRQDSGPDRGDPAMLLTSEDVAKAELTEAGKVLNGVDNANVLSIDSTTPITTPVDEVSHEHDTRETATPDEAVIPKTEKVSKEVIEEPPEDTKESDDKPASEEADEKVEVVDAVQKRINEITRKRRIAERERDFEQAKRKELEAELAKFKATVPPSDKPQRDLYDTDIEFFEALTEWTIEQKLKASQESAVKEKSEVDEKQQMMAVYNEIDAIMERGRGKYKDFNQLVLDNSLPITESMTEAILQSEVADDLMYYLGSNPAITEKLSKLSPFKAAAEIGKIEAKLTTKVDPVPEVRKRATSAPDPITPIRTTGVTDKDPAGMSPKEYRAWRERNK
jgi:hypothetical protein